MAFQRYSVRDIIRASGVEGWYWHGMLLPGNATLLTADWRAGKSTLIFCLLGHMFREMPFLNLPTRKPTGVVYFTEESPQSLRWKVVQWLSPDWPIAFYAPTPDTTWREVLQVIKALADYLIVIDTISEFADVRDENSIEFGRVARQLVRVLRETNNACLVVHHATKWASDKAGKLHRGHTSFPASLDITIEMRPEDESRGVLLTRSRYAETLPEVPYAYSPLLGVIPPEGLTTPARRAHNKGIRGA